MIDNGLLKHYPQLASSDGFLKTKDLDLKPLPVSLKGVATPYFYQSNVVWYKHEDDGEIESQVLLSQLYSKLGLKSAIYMPAVDEHGDHLTISDNVDTADNISGRRFFKRLYEIFPKEVVDGELIKRVAPVSVLTSVEKPNLITLDQSILFGSPTFLPLLKDYLKKYKPEEFDFVSFFTKDGMRDFIKMHVMDTGSCNIDRNSSNFYFKIDGSGKICGIETIDHSMSKNYLLNEGFKYATYINFLGPFSEATRTEMVDELRNNETVQQFMLRQEMAEIVGNVEVEKTAQDIKQATGFEIDTEYVDGLARSYDSLANDLAR
ncbi:MAG: hypothetical protein IJD48_04750 [Clostridia bacterium]|nr:hypothetical protein [Clostridia bacterium]